MDDASLSNEHNSQEVLLQSNSSWINGLWIAIKSDAFMLSRLRGPWLLVALPAVATLIRLVLAKISVFSQAARGALLAGDGEVAQTSGYGFFVDGIVTGLTLLYLIFIGYAAHSIAYDRDQGIARHLTIRSVSRIALVSGRFSTLLILASLSALAVLLSAWIVTELMWDFSPVIEDGFEIIGVADMQFEIKQGLKLALLPLPACVALGLLFSVCARSATQAVTLAVGFTLAIDLFKAGLGDIAHYFYASFQPSLLDQSYLSDVARIVRGYSDVLIDERVYQLNMWLPLPQAAVFLVLALVIIRGRTL